MNLTEKHLDNMIKSKGRIDELHLGGKLKQPARKNALSAP